MVDLCDLFTNILQAYSSGIGAVLLLQYRNETWFNTEMPSYQYMNIDCGNKTILEQSHLRSGVFYTDNHSETQ